LNGKVFKSQSSDFANANLDEIKDVYASVGWMKHTNEIIRQAFEDRLLFIVNTQKHIKGT
jgi:hypothetical protein